jgi:2-polyprenylphenol 6-hydroxylase
VAIVGGGLVGATLARVLAPCNFSVALIEPRARQPVPEGGFDQRIYALSARSRQIMERSGVWPFVLHGRVAPVHAMRVFGDDKVSALEFSAYRSGVAELACIVEESNLGQALTHALDGQAGLAMFEGVECTAMTSGASVASLSFSDGSSIEAKLVVAADGAHSRLRERAGIRTRVHDYGQTGVVANFAAARPPGNTAFQWFREDGILALLPLPGGRVSMVWSAQDAVAQALLAMDAGALARAVEDASGGMLGALTLEGKAAGFALRRMHAERLVASRLALIGDAAHNVHPLAGQGLNLGLGDVQSLAAILAERGMENDCGAAGLLRRYEISRGEDIFAMEFVTDGLQKLFGSSLPGIPRLRNVGLRMAERFPPLKRILVNRALG